MSLDELFIPLSGAGVASRVSQIANVRVQPLEAPSAFVRPMSVLFEQQGKSRRWDMVLSHPSVAVIAYHRDLNALVMVRQFRPAVLGSLLLSAASSSSLPVPPGPEPLPAAAAGPREAAGSAGAAPLALLPQCFTYELCAGIVDKSKPLEEIAQEELLEETGFRVPASSLRRVAVALTAVGISGAQQTLFYTEVSEDSKADHGGGNAHEGEAIDVVALPVGRIDCFLSRPDLPKTPGALFGLMWFKATVLPGLRGGPRGLPAGLW